jgi:hypothetical protein
MSTEQPTATSLFNEFTGAVLDGGKIGLAASLAQEITDTIIDAAGVPLPEFLKKGMGSRILPIVVCYAVALATVLIPGFPAAATVRHYAVMGAKGSAAVFMSDAAVGKKLKSLSYLIVGIGQDKVAEGLPKPKDESEVKTEAAK